MGSMDNLAHKMLHTFEKMDPINPIPILTRLRMMYVLGGGSYCWGYNEESILQV